MTTTDYIKPTWDEFPRYYDTLMESYNDGDDIHLLIQVLANAYGVAHTVIEDKITNLVLVRKKVSFNSSNNNNKQEHEHEHEHEHEQQQVNTMTDETKTEKETTTMKQNIEKTAKLAHICPG